MEDDTEGESWIERRNVTQFLRRLDDERNITLERRLTALETFVRLHAEEEEKNIAEILELIKVKQSLTLWAKALGWLTGLGAGAATIWAVIRWKA